MKVLHITPGYFDSELYKCLFEAQAQNGIESVVFAPVNGAAYREKQLKNEGYVYICEDKLKRALFFPKQRETLAALKAHTEYGSCQLIHAHTLFSAGYTAWKLYKECGLPYIVAVRSTDTGVFFKYMLHLRKSGIKIIKDAHKVIFLSSAYKKEVIEKYVPEKLRQEIAGKSEIIPNGIDQYFLDNLHTRTVFPQFPLRIIYVGEITQNKNVMATIKAVESLNERGMAVKLKIVGEIKEEKYRALFAEIPFVKYFEPCCKEEVVRYLRTADIFVMPSFYETFGLVYAEAMSQGLPVIYTKGQGFDGQFPEGEVGYHVDPHNPQEIAEKIVKILNNYNEISRRCTENSRFFDWNEIAKRYMLIYSQLL